MASLRKGPIVIIFVEIEKPTFQFSNSNNGWSFWDLDHNFRDDARHMNTLTNLVMENKDDKSEIFYLKVRYGIWDSVLSTRWIFFYLFGRNLDGKVDIEGHELDALPEWIESGALEKVFLLKIRLNPSILKVGQLAMELHLRRIHQQKK